MIGHDTLDVAVWRRSVVDTLGLHWLKVLLLSFVAHALVVTGLLVTPLEPAKLSADLFAAPDRFASLVLTPRPGVAEVPAVSSAGEKVSLGELRARAATRPRDRAVLEHGASTALRGESGEVSPVFVLGGPDGGVDDVLGGTGGSVGVVLGGVRGAIGDAGGFGRLGIRGIGGGGGRGTSGRIHYGSAGGVGSMSIGGTVGYGRGSGSSASRGYGSGAPSMKAGRHDDNKQFNRFLEFLRANGSLVTYPVDVSERIVLEARDENGRSLHDCEVRIGDAAGKTLVKRRTYADGSTQFFPKAAGSSPEYLAVATCGGRTRTTTVARDGPRTVTLRFDFARTVPARVPVDIAVVLDTTGSMQSQIARLKRTLAAIHVQLTALPTHPDIRFALVAYRDRGDAYVTRNVPFTRDVEAFQAELRGVRADGGGDTPEDLQEALRVAMRDLAWRADALRLGFVVADAPPHTDYGQKYTYRSAMREALTRGIKWSTVGAGGLARAGEVIFRQIAQQTRGEYVFVTQGERVDSEGGSGEASHHVGSNYRVENLDQAVVRIVRRELSYLTDDPRDFDDTIVASSQRPLPRDEVLVPAVREAMRQLTDYAAIRLEEGTPTAVVPMAAPDEQHRDVTEYLVEQMTLAASRQSVFQVVERDLRALAQEQRLQLSDLFDVANTVPFGKLVGAELLIVSRLTVRGERAELYAKLVRVETGEVLSAARVSFRNGVIALARGSPARD